MTYTEAKHSLEEIKVLLQNDGHFKTSYTTVYAAILNKITSIAATEVKNND